MRIEDVGKGMKPKLHEKKSTPEKQKKPRRSTIRDASFFLYKKDKDDGSLSRIGSFETLPEIVGAYGKALDEGIPRVQLEGHKTKILEFEVKEIERKIRAN